MRSVKRSSKLRFALLKKVHMLIINFKIGKTIREHIMARAIQLTQYRPSPLWYLYAYLGTDDGNKCNDVLHRLHLPSKF